MKPTIIKLNKAQICKVSCHSNEKIKFIRTATGSHVQKISNGYEIISTTHGPYAYPNIFCVHTRSYIPNGTQWLDKNDQIPKHLQTLGRSLLSKEINRLLQRLQTKKTTAMFIAQIPETTAYYFKHFRQRSTIYVSQYMAIYSQELRTLSC